MDSLDTDTGLSRQLQALVRTLDSVTQGVTYVDSSQRIRFYNRRYLELLDLPESLLARQPHVEEVVRLQTERGDFGELFSLIDPSARQYVAAEFASHGPRLQVPDVYLRRTRQGRVIEVRTTMLPEGGRVRTFTDVTHYFDVQEALRQNEARWRALTELSSDWYWEQDDQFRYVHVDANFERVAGVPAHTYLGRRRWDMPSLNVTPEEWARHRSLLEAHLPFRDFEVQRPLELGGPHWVSISGLPVFDAEGTFKGYRGIGRDISERKRDEARVSRMAYVDELTGLPNRRSLVRRLEQILQDSRRDGSYRALLFLDLDNFKHLNDTHGHEQGDLLLAQVASRLMGHAQGSHEPARLGGDEFVVVLARCADAADEARVARDGMSHAQALLVQLVQPYTLRDTLYRGSPSVGVTVFGPRHTTVSDVLREADQAMYRAKLDGGARIKAFDPQEQPLPHRARR